MSQRNVTSCDACKRDDLPAGHVILTATGDRSSIVRSRIDGGRNSLDLCDDCAAAFGAWVVQRGLPPEPEPEPAPAVAETPTDEAKMPSIPAE